MGIIEEGRFKLYLINLNASIKSHIGLVATYFSTFRVDSAGNHMKNWILKSILGSGPEANLLKIIGLDKIVASVF